MKLSIFLSNSNNNLVMHIGTIDSKGEPNVTVNAFYFDEPTERIYFTTLRSSEKVQHSNNKNVISFCINDPNVTYKGAKTFSLAEAADALRYLASRPGICRIRYRGCFGLVPVSRLV